VAGCRGATVVVRLTFCRAATLAGTLRRADLANILFVDHRNPCVEEQEQSERSGGFGELGVVVSMGVKLQNRGLDNPPALSITSDWLKLNCLFSPTRDHLCVSDVEGSAKANSDFRWTLFTHSCRHIDQHVSPAHQVSSPTLDYCRIALAAQLQT
jgi:hypothetical protein